MDMVEMIHCVVCGVLVMIGMGPGMLFFPI